MNSVYIEITNACNLQCSFCPCGAQNRDASTGATNHIANNVHRDFMSTALFEKCIDGAQEVGASEVYFHVLGEPTLHPAFSLFIKKLEQTPLKLTLTTNGTTIIRIARHILNSPAVRQVNFSTHAFAELPMDDACGHLENVLDFCKIALAARPDLYVNLRLWNVGDSDSCEWNIHMLERIRETFGVDVQPGHFCSRHKSFPITGRLYLHQDTRFEWPETSKVTELAEVADEASPQGCISGTCRALDTHLAILHDGQVVACCLDYSGQTAFGNISTEKLTDILQTPAVLKMQGDFANHQVSHPLCKNCNFRRRFK